MTKNLQLAAAATVLFGVITLTACSDNPPPGGVVKGTPPTDAHKTIAVLCMMADVNYDLVTTSEAALNRNTLKVDDALRNNAALRAYIGNDWRVVWGPVTANSPKKSNVSAVDSFVTDNTMYVARGTNLATGKNMYVVAIAGTNMVSQKGWKLEDFNVIKEADWIALNGANNGKISAGSNLGFTILNTMADATTGKTLLQFLSTLKDAGNTEVAFTGHSLGGALSPLMALRSIEWKEQVGYSNIAVSVYPMAGPTPGNKEFAVYAGQKFGDNYHSVINNYDIVPHSWQKDMFSEIPSLYKNAPPFNPGGTGGFQLPVTYQLAYDGIRVAIDLKTYQRISPDREFVFNGRPNSYPDGSGTFFKEAGYQHGRAYFKDAFQFPQPVIDVITQLLSN